MAYKIRTPEEIQKILEDYRNRELTVAEVCERNLIESSSLSMLLTRMNEPRRHPKISAGRSAGKSAKAKSCPCCRKKVDLAGARFCPYCGADIRSNNELLADRLLKFAEYNYAMPETIRDDFIKAINEATIALKKA